MDNGGRGRPARGRGRSTTFVQGGINREDLESEPEPMSPNPEGYLSGNVTCFQILCMLVMHALLVALS